MSGTIGSSSGLLPSGMYGVLANDSAGIKQKLNQLTQQSATGLVSNTYAGLGVQATVSINMRPQLQAIGTWQNNISQAGTQLQMTQSALQQLSDIASSFASQTLGMSAQTSAGVDSIATQAKAALSQVQVLLNSQNGGNYLLAGQDQTTQPLSDTALANFVAQVQAPISALATGGGAAAATAAMTAATTTALTTTGATTGRAMAEVGPGQQVALGVVAGQNTYAVQSGASTTGSYVKDLVAGLASLAAMSSGQTALGTDFTTVTTAIGTTLKGAVNALSTEMAGVGTQQAHLTHETSVLSDLSTTLTSQISSVENVDMASTATALTQVQTQLQASYQLISGMHGLSLVSFLVAGG